MELILPKTLKKISVPSAGRVSPQLWESCVETLLEGCQVSAPRGAAVGTGPSGQWMWPEPQELQAGRLMGKGTEGTPWSKEVVLRILAAHPQAWLRTLPSLCFRCFLLLLVSLLLRRIVISINTCTWLPGFRGKAWFCYFSSCCFLGCLTHPPDGDPSPNSIPRLHSPHSLPALDLPLPQPPPPPPPLCG